MKITQPPSVNIPKDSEVPVTNISEEYTFVPPIIKRNMAKLNIENNKLNNQINELYV